MRHCALAAVLLCPACTTLVARSADRAEAGGDEGEAGGEGDGADAGPVDVGPAPACATADAHVVTVTTAAELTTALADAAPGDRIELADGTYQGAFVISRPGSPEAPIALCGSADAVLRGDDVTTGYGVHIVADDWVLSGFAVTRAKKGVVVDGGERDVLWGLSVYAVGEEAIHLRAFSSDNVVANCAIRDTGLNEPGFGEGIYVGSAESNWPEYSGGQPDRSDGNQLVDNRIGPGVTAEAIDLHPGTTGGIVRGNRFDGDGMSGANFADSWVDVKGNDYVIDGNTGSATLLDGFQSHVVVDGWGQRAVFRKNRMDGVPGYGITVDPASAGTVVACDNEIAVGGSGLSNVACQ